MVCPEFHKTIIYLDHNFISNMAKAQPGLIKDEARRQQWSDLYALLLDLVRSDKVICPASEFHAIEADLDQRRREKIWEVSMQLSLGIRLRPWKAIQDYQIWKAIRGFKGMPLEEGYDPLTEAFDTHPFTPANSRHLSFLGGRILATARHDTPAQDIATRRQRKEDYARLMEMWRMSRQSQQLSFEDARRAEEDYYVHELHSGPYERAMQGFTRADPQAILGSGWIEASTVQAMYADVDPKPEGFEQFLKSPELRQIPMISILCRIYAWIGTDGRERRPKPSDLYDFRMAATVLPYVDILCTDAFLRSLVCGHLKLADEYQTEVYSVADVDNFTAKLRDEHQGAT